MEKNIKSFGEEVNKNLPPSPYIIPGMSNKLLQKYTLQDILEAVCKVLDISEEAIKTKTLKRKITFARQLVYYFSYYYTRSTKTKIGEFFNILQPAVAHGIRTIEGFIETRQYLEEINKVDKELRKKLI